MFKTSQGRVAPRIGGTRFNTSYAAQALPIIIGRVQVPGKLIWLANQQTHYNTGKKSSKLNKKGGPGVADHTADLDLLLGTPGFGRVSSVQNTTQGLQSILDVWSDKARFQVAFTQQTLTVVAGAVTLSVPAAGILICVLGMTVATGYTITFNDYGNLAATFSQSGSYAKNLWNTQFHYYDNSGSTPVAGSSRTPNYNASPGIDFGPVPTIPVDSSLNGQQVIVYYAYATSGPAIPVTQAAQFFEEQLGDSGATGQSRVYTDVGGVAAPDCDLGTATIAPNFKYEAVTWGSSPSGDANPADILPLLIMGPHGLNLASYFTQIYGGPSTIIDNYSGMRAYCDAYGIWISPYLDQQKGMDQLNDLFDVSNCAGFWSEGLLKVVPRSEVSIAGKAAIFNAPTAAGPLWVLNSQDFVVQENTEPIEQERRMTSADGSFANIMAVEFTDRSNEYALDYIEVQEATSVSEYGARRSQETLTMHWLMSGSLAAIVGSPIIKRKAITERSVFKFTLGPRHIQIEPMDLVVVNEPIAQLVNVPMQIISANINSRMEIECEAAPFIYGANTPAPPVAQGGSSQPTYTNVDPGSCNTPVIFEPVTRLVTQLGGSTTPQLWIAVSGSNANYGGCGVWVSQDGGASYTRIGAIFGNSTQGLTKSNPWAAGTDPDTTHDLLIDLTMSNGTRSSFSAVQADGFVDPCYVGGGAGVIPYELICPTLATLTSAHKYTLNATGGGGNEIRRAVFSAPQVGSGVSHPINSDFVDLLGPLFKTNLDPRWIGTALKFKFTAFNRFATNEQSLAAVSPVTFTPTGGPTNSVPTYAISPVSPLSQPTPGPYEVDMAQVTATMTLGSSSFQVRYNARTFSVADPGVGLTQQYWVTIYDPGFTGDSGTSTSLSAFCDSNQTRWNTAGYTRIGTIVVTHGGGTSGGGGGTASGSLQTLTVSGAKNGSNTIYTLSSAVSFLMLFLNDGLVDPADYIFTGSGFTMTAYTPIATDNFNAYGF